jgi:hypothetical protein
MPSQDPRDAWPGRKRAVTLKGSLPRRPARAPAVRALQGSVQHGRSTTPESVQASPGRVGSGRSGPFQAGPDPSGRLHESCAPPAHGAARLSLPPPRSMPSPTPSPLLLPLPPSHPLEAVFPSLSPPTPRSAGRIAPDALFTRWNRACSRQERRACDTTSLARSSRLSADARAGATPLHLAAVEGHVAALGALLAPPPPPPPPPRHPSGPAPAASAADVAAAVEAASGLGTQQQ